MKRYVAPAIMASIVMTGCSSQTPRESYLEEISSQIPVYDDDVADSVYDLGMTYCDFIDGPAGSVELFYTVGLGNDVSYDDLYAITQAAEQHLC